MTSGSGIFLLRRQLPDPISCRKHSTPRADEEKSGSEDLHENLLSKNDWRFVILLFAICSIGSRAFYYF